MGCKVKLVVTDGVFSMDGNIAPLRYVSYADGNEMPMNETIVIRGVITKSILFLLSADYSS